MNITQDNLDIFTGSHVEVSISNQIDNQVVDLPLYFQTSVIT
ncbi:Uncharacterised protein [Escherichia coli]|nr:Uncharacterised protein [Escherichia coli]